MVCITKKIKTILFSIGIIFILFISSCNLFNTISDNEYATIYISVNSKSTFLTRAAIPVLPDEIVYSFEAVSASYSSSVKNDTDSQPEGYFENPTEFMLKLKPGIWDITATGSNTTNQAILTGSYEQLEVAANGEYHISIPVFFIKDSSKNGSCNLQIKTTGTNIASLKITGTQNGTKTNLDGTYNVTTDTNGDKIINISTTSSVMATNHSPVFTFYTNTNGTGTIVTVIAGETINVRQNMTTDTWYKTGNTLYLKYKDENNTDGKSGAADFILTQKIIDLLENSDIYVSANGSDDNDGSVWLPYKTLGAAINRVNELNNVNFDAKHSDSSIARKAFNIYCDGTITQSTNIILNPDHDLNLTIKPKSNNSASINLGSNKINYTATKSNTISIENIELNGEIHLGGETSVENYILELESVTGAVNLTNESYNKVNANNTSFATITLGQNSDDSSIVNPTEKAELTLTGCTVETLNCYGTASSGSQTNKCTITATNTIFNAACTCSGNFTATNCNLNSSLTLSKDSTFTFTGNSTTKNDIKALITISGNSTATIENAKIGTGITSGNDSIFLSDLAANSSSLTLKNSEITKNLNASANQISGNIIFKGNTHFTGDVTSFTGYKLQLGNNAHFYVDNITATTNEDSSKYAAIELVNPVPNQAVVVPWSGTTFSQAQFNRFELHNPGYYLYYDSVDKQGKVKLSSVRIIEPELDGCILEIEGITENNGTYTLSDPNHTITVTAKDKENNNLQIEKIRQIIGGHEVESSNENIITFDCSVAGTYILSIRFIYNNTTLDVNIPICVE